MDGWFDYDGVWKVNVGKCIIYKMFIFDIFCIGVD